MLESNLPYTSVVNSLDSKSFIETSSESVERILSNGEKESIFESKLEEISGRRVAWFKLGDAKNPRALKASDALKISKLITTAIELEIPVVGSISITGFDLRDGITALAAWGALVRSLSSASGVIPTFIIVTGPCVSSVSLLLGIVDIVIFTEDAHAFVSAPSTVAGITGAQVSPTDLGGYQIHANQSGLSSFVVQDEEEALVVVLDVLSYLPSSCWQIPPKVLSQDPTDRQCNIAESVVPNSSSASYDMVQVINDIVDEDTFLELRFSFAPNILTGFARIGGISIGIIANQPSRLAGTIDIEGSQKAARFVQMCDAFNVSLLTLVDTPGFQPGKDLEWRGMIRHGAQLVHAYGVASVPRVSMVIRKAYGGAYIVMDSKGLGNDICFAWPNAEIAVMGASGAVQILHGRKLAQIEDDQERLRTKNELEQQYAQRFCTAELASERGYVDDIIEPSQSRELIFRAFEMLETKREELIKRKHSNSPL